MVENLASTGTGAGCATTLPGSIILVTMNNIMIIMMLVMMIMMMMMMMMTMTTMIMFKEKLT